MTVLESLDGVIFDMDGVIFDTERLSLECWVEIGGRYGLEDIDEAARLCIGRSTADSRLMFEERYGGRIDIDALQEESRQYLLETIRREGLPEKKGARELLRWLREKGARVGLCSSTREQTVRRQLTDTGLIGYFDTLVCGDMVEHSKPLPDIYLMACERLGVRPGKTAAIEDSRNGIISCSEAGMIPILVPDLVVPDEEMLKRKAKLFESLIEFKEWLSSEME